MRYIDAEKTIEVLKSIGCRDYRREKGTIQDAIKILSYEEYTPTAEVKPVVRAEVVTTIDEWHVIHQNCSICNEELEYKSYPNFCPNCGADLRGDK